MRLPWVSRKAYDKAVELRMNWYEEAQERAATIDALISDANMFERQRDAARAEVDRLRNELLAERNEHAATRGKLMAAKHGNSDLL